MIYFNLAAFLIFSMFFASPGNATVYGVDKAGKATNTCEQAAGAIGLGDTNSMLTIAAAIACMKEGDDLVVGKGVYVEAIVYTQSSRLPSGTEDDRVIIRGKDGEKWELAPNATQCVGRGNPGNVIAFLSQSYITIKGAVVNGALCDDGAIRVSDNSHHINIKGNEIKNAPLNCIGEQNNTVHHNEYVNNYLHDCGTDTQDHGIYIRGDNSLIERNEITNIAGFGIHFWAKTRSIDNNIVRYNVVHHNKSWGILLGSGNGNLAYGNIIYRNGSALRGGGMRIGGGSNNRFINNTVFANRNYCGIIGGASAVDAVYDNNICWLNRLGGIDDKGTGTTIANTFLTDPSFKSETDGSEDLSLQAGSKAIDAGPIECRFRATNGLKCDAGAYETSAPTDVPVALRFKLEFDCTVKRLPDDSLDIICSKP